MLRQPLRRWLGLILGPLARKTTLLVDTSVHGLRRLLAVSHRAGRRSRRGQAGDLRISEIAAQGRLDVDLRTAGGGRVGGGREATPVPHAADGARRRSTGARRWTSTLAHALEEAAAQLSPRARRCSPRPGATIETHDGPLGDNPQLLAQRARVPGGQRRAQPVHRAVQRRAHRPAGLRRAAADRARRAPGRQSRRLHELPPRRRPPACSATAGSTTPSRTRSRRTTTSSRRRSSWRSRRGCRVLTLGPLNNETKRRAGGELRPIVSSLWNKNSRRSPRGAQAVHQELRSVPGRAGRRAADETFPQES